VNFHEFFENKIILVTGGTGSIGSEIVSQLLNFNPKTIRIFSNSENELWELKVKLQEHVQKLRFLIGDIRNYERVNRAAQNVDYIFNAAAIKHVPIGEYNPMETISVNIHGLENIIEASYACNVKKVIHISTDKAVNPTTVMGATKMLGERLCISREMTKGKNKTIISCVRFGNVIGSRGSIIPLIIKQINNGNTVTLTDAEMRRFFLSIPQAVELVLKSIVLAQGGEIFVLKMPTILIKDLLEVIIEEHCKAIGKDPNSIKIKLVGSRIGEKLYEELISPIEYSNCYETEDMYIVYPNVDIGHELAYNVNKIGNKVDISKNFDYTNESATPLTKGEIKDILKELHLV
jgi:UDP-N-acetylglucosamine 4,6-dehydratase